MKNLYHWRKFMNSYEQKKCKTSIRVLQTLILLTKQPASIQEILNFFKETEQEIYTNEVILKYLNTLKVFGFRFIKEKNKYILTNQIPQINLNKNEIEGFNILLNLAQKYPNTEIYKNLSKLQQNLEKRFDNNTRIEKSNLKISIGSIPDKETLKYKNLITKLEQYCKDKQRVKITYLNRNQE